MRVRALTADDALEVASWRYPGRDSTYDVLEPPSAEDGFWAVEHEGELLGYCCFGAEARVPGVHEDARTLDIGYGMRPERVGTGLGPAFVAEIVRFGVEAFEPRRLRVVILDWNERSRRAAEGLGFVEVGAVTNDGGTFLLLERDP